MIDDSRLTNTRERIEKSLLVVFHIVFWASLFWMLLVNNMFQILRELFSSILCAVICGVVCGTSITIISKLTYDIGDLGPAA